MMASHDDDDDALPCVCGGVVVQVMMGDGQVTLQDRVIIKHNANKVRALGSQALGGFAGASGDALTLFEMLEGKLEAYPGQMLRACVELSKAWRSDNFLRRLEVVCSVSTLHTFSMCAEALGVGLCVHVDGANVLTRNYYCALCVRVLCE